MAVSLSVALKNYLLGTGELKAALAGGFIYVYTGDVPATADTALTDQTLICKIGSENPPTDDTPATGLDLGTAASGAIAKDSDVWIGRVQGGVDGVAATFFRWVDAADDPSLAGSGTSYRIQGTCGAQGADLNFNPNSFTDAAENSKSIGSAEIRIG